MAGASRGLAMNASEKEAFEEWKGEKKRKERAEKVISGAFTYGPSIKEVRYLPRTGS